MAKLLYREDSEVDGEVHFLELRDKYIESILCFPQYTCSFFEERLNLLLGRGFIYFVEAGSRFMDRWIIGKGYSAVVVLAYNKYKGLGALKILRVDSRRRSLAREGEIMEKAQVTGLPPRLLDYSDLYVFYEFLPYHKCTSLDQALEVLLGEGRVSELRNLLENLLYKLWLLDNLRVDHTEINRPWGHVYVCNGNVKILDWESARISSKPSNLTSMVSYLLYRFRSRGNLTRVLGIDVDRVIPLLRVYKTTYDAGVLAEILGAMGLTG